MTPSRARIAASNCCATVGVLLLIVGSLFPADWYPAVPLFLGLALLAVAHILTPCEGRITVWRKTRVAILPPR